MLLSKSLAEDPRQKLGVPVTPGLCHGIKGTHAWHKCIIHLQTLSLFFLSAEQLVPGVIGMDVAAKTVFYFTFLGWPVKPLLRLEVCEDLLGFSFKGEGKLDCCLFC